MHIKIKSNFSAQDINSNFERNFPLKEDYYKLYAFIKKGIFGVNPIPDKVMELDDNWLFCGDYYDNNLSESFHILNFNISELENLNIDLKEKKEWCEQNKITYYLAIAPNKESIYSNLIPLHKYKQPSKMEQLEKICKNLDVGYINLGKNFPKNEKQILYYKTDTHWNEYASYFGYTSVLEALNERNITNFKKVPITNYELINTDVLVGDLNEISLKEKNEYQVKLSPINNYKEIYSQEEKKLVVPDGYEYHPSIYENRYSAPNKKLKILILHDSFGGYLSKFLSPHFKESVFIWQHDFNKKLILSEKPDIVIQEFVERSVDFLLEANK